MVYVHHSPQESSSIDLLEVGVGCLTLNSAPFFAGWIAFLNFSLAEARARGKKSEKKKKVRKQVEQKGRPPNPPNPPCPLALTRSMTNVFPSKA
jgi:hypothetical protein